jgi:hypothetical protein
MLRQWVADGLITESAAAELAEQFGLTTEAAQVLGAQRPVVYVSAAGIPQTNENFRRVKAAAATIPRLKTIMITADGSSAIATANGVKRYIDGLTGRITIVSHTVPSHQTFGGGQAAGGPIRADKWYVIGEDGPEIFAPGMDGTIIPNNALANLPMSAMGFGGGAGGGTASLDVTLHVTGSGGVARLIHEEVRAGRIQLSANGQRVRAGL